MLSRVKWAFMIAAIALLFAGAANAEDKPWFDWEKCELCKVFMEYPMLMSATQWEEFELHNGTVTVTTITKEQLPSYRAANEKMMKQIERLEKGDTLYLCGLCTEIGRLMELGADYEYFETKDGSISLFTSDDPEVIAAIKAMSAKSQEEWKKMEMKKKSQGGQEQGHEGHDHD